MHDVHAGKACSVYHQWECAAATSAGSEIPRVLVAVCGNVQAAALVVVLLFVEAPLRRFASEQACLMLRPAADGTEIAVPDAAAAPSTCCVVCCVACLHVLAWGWCSRKWLHQGRSGPLLTDLRWDVLLRWLCVPVDWICTNSWDAQCCMRLAQRLVLVGVCAQHIMWCAALSELAALVVTPGWHLGRKPCTTNAAIERVGSSG